MYLPIPPRVWSRVESTCVYDISSNYTPIYIPLTNQTTSKANADIETQLQYKGNILQYKANSAMLTSKQKYSQFASLRGPNRTKVFATQTQTYSNPNTIGFARINSVNIPYPNSIVGSPNNLAGPFALGILNPNDCSGNSIEDGGSLTCNRLENPCTKQTTKNIYQPLCYPSYCSDVPGKPIPLCWNSKLPTYFPKTRTIMPTSGSKWPQGYKAFVSALRPSAPVFTLVSNTDTTAIFSWQVEENLCIPITGFQIYQNGIKYVVLSYNVRTITINITIGSKYWITSISNTIESAASNQIEVL